MKGNVHLMKMVEKAEEQVGQVEWMARVNGDMEVERGRMAWSWWQGHGLEHAAEVWWPGGKVVGRKLEAVQDRIGRKLLGASKTVAGVAV